eukprot:s6828_g2.t2
MQFIRVFQFVMALRMLVDSIISTLRSLSFPSLFERRDTKTLQQPFWALMLLTLVVYGSMRHLLDALKKRGASEEVLQEIKELTAFKTPPKCIRLAMEGVACLLEKPRKSWEAPKGREAKPEDAQDLGVSENPKW